MSKDINQSLEVNLNTGEFFNVHNNNASENIYRITNSPFIKLHEYVDSIIDTTGNRFYNTTNYHDYNIFDSIQNVNQNLLTIVGGNKTMFSGNNMDMISIGDININSINNNVNIKGKTIFETLSIPHDGSPVLTATNINNNGSISITLSCKGNGVNGSDYQSVANGVKKNGIDGTFNILPELPGNGGEIIIIEWLNGTNQLSFRFNINVNTVYGTGTTNLDITALLS